MTRPVSTPGPGGLNPAESDRNPGESPLRPGVHVEYLLRLADDCLILSHRLAQWSSRGPQLEEDIALTNIGLDLLGQARGLLTRAGEVEGAGRTEDDLAYLREEHEFRCCLLVEQPDRDDFGIAMARQFLFTAYQLPLLHALTTSTDPGLAAVAAKGVKEVRYHFEHVAGWVIRLGDGTQESHRRMQQAITAMWPYAGELFDTDPVTEAAVTAGFGPDPAELAPEWQRTVDSVLAEATLEQPAGGFRLGTGRTGRHSEHLGYLLAEMQYLHRLHPGARW